MFDQPERNASGRQGAKNECLAAWEGVSLSSGRCQQTVHYHRTRTKKHFTGRTCISIIFWPALRRSLKRRLTVFRPNNIPGLNVNMPAMRLANGKSVHCMWSMRARVAETGCTHLVVL